MTAVNFEFEHLLRDFVTCERELRALDEKLKTVKARNVGLRLMIHDALQQSGLPSFTMEDLGRFVPLAQLYVHVQKPELGEQGEVIHQDAQAELEAWSREQVDAAGRSLFDDLFGWSIKSAVLKATVRQRLEDNEDPPPGVDFGYQKNIQWTPPESIAKQRSRRASRKEATDDTPD